MSLASGSRLGVYEVTAPLGSGGMGEVYRATDTRLKRQVAIKILGAAVAAERETSPSDRLARFQREAEVLASLNHPCIAAVYGLEDVPASLGSGTALVMELVEGPTLADRIAQAPIPVDEVLSIAGQIAEALEAAHEQGIIHRDLKPANIKVRDDGTVKVLDFGLAKLTDAHPARRDDSGAAPTITSDAMTAMGVALGTPAYMSPEQARGRAVDKRTDVWAFGAVLYEMLARARAFPGEDVAETIAAVMRSTPDWAALPGDVPPQVVTLIQRCLEKDRRTRIGDIAVARFLLSEHVTLSGRTSAPPPSSASGAAASAANTPVAGRRQALPWAIAAVALLAALAATIVPGLRRAETVSSPPVRFLIPLPDDAELLSTQGTTMPMISPDGERVAFVALSGGSPQIWVRSLSELEAQPLAGTENGTQAFWSPDSRTIGFAAGGRVNTVAVDNGAVRTVCDAPSFFRGGAWNPDGVILYGSLAGGIYRVPASGGQPTPVTTPDAERGESAHRFPSFLPDGRHFLYVAFPSNTVWIGSLDGQAATQLVAADSQAQYAAPGYLLFARDAAVVAQPFDANRRTLSGDAVAIAENPLQDLNGTAAFSVSGTGAVVLRAGIASRTTQLTWTDRGGKPVGTLGPPNRYRNPALSPDDTRVAAEVLDLGTRSQDIWILEAGRSEASRFTFDRHDDIWPAWSPDGSRLAFASDREAGKANLYGKPSDGSAAEELLLESGAETLAAPLSWSPDGSLLVYRRFAPYSNMALLPVAGEPGAQPTLFQQVAATQAQGQVSPNGRWLAYHSNETGSNEVFVQSFPTPGAKWQVSKDGGYHPKWRRDGRELFYYGTGGQLMAAAIAGDVALDIGAPVPLFTPGLLNGPVVGVGFRAQYDVARDGRFLLNVPVGDPPPSPIAVVLNWAAGLAR
jgi:serine/threonine protein kinase/Tol biopolymer transport system component